MNDTMINRTIKLSVILSASMFIVLYLIEGKNFNYMSAIGKTLTVVTVIWFFYFNYGWKLKFLNKVFNVPNLNGTWIGSLESDWKDEHGKGVGEIEFAIVIKQSFLNFHIKTFTKNYAGKSYIEKLDFNEKEKEIKLAYFYHADIISVEEDTREGVAELRILIDSECLKGKYWTRNKTSGIINVRYLQKKLCSTYDEIIDKKSKGE